MGEWQVSQPGADNITSPREAALTAQQVIAWDGSEDGWAQGNNKSCRMVGDTLVCDADIYGSSKPQTYAEAFRAIIPLAQELGLLPQNRVYRVSDNGQPQPFYPPGTYAIPAGSTAEQPVKPYYADQYSYHQVPDGDFRPMPVGTPGTPAQTSFDPYSFHQNDRTAPAIPAFKPVADIPLPPVPPQDAKPQAPVDNVKPANQPNPDRPGNPCQPCRPGRIGGRGGCGWYPGKIAGHVVGRIFGGGRRCR